MRRSLTRREVLKLGGGALAGAYTFALAGCGAHGGGGSQSASAENYPQQTLNWTIAFGPGGGNDIMSRTLIEILQKNDLYTENIVATNLEGGDGARGWGFLYDQKGNSYHISSTSGSFMTTPLAADTPWGPTSFTPIGMLAIDDTLFIVKEDSPYDSLEEFVAAAKEEPLPIGGIATINIDFIMAELLSQQAGFELKYVAFNDEGEMISALVSESLEMIASNPAEVLGLVESGDAKALAFSGKERMRSLPDVPTLDELGYNIDVNTPRGVVLAPGVNQGVQQWWIDTMKKAIKTPAWRQYLKENDLIEKVLWGAEFEDYLTNTQAKLKRTLKEAGAL
ncbi:MAG TPA: tripartite tricarboxylate transporter substrate binding protein [Rubrobacter sp.]|jgi:putative tricarboxylic transport membrane protein|nr:tripartite tricarboxylate transporter substrate binding protein [Rubrobacter sp.]